MRLHSRNSGKHVPFIILKPILSCSWDGLSKNGDGQYLECMFWQRQVNFVILCIKKVFFLYDKTVFILFPVMHLIPCCCFSY